HPHVTAGEGGHQVGEQPGATLTPPPDHDAVAPGVGHHGHGVLGRPDIPVAQHRDVGDLLLQGGDRVPVGGAGVVVGRRAGMQGDGGDPGVPGAACRVQVGQVVGVDAHAHLDGHRHVGSASLFGGGRDDGAEQVGLPGEHRSPALAGDLGYRATEVEVDVVGAVLLDEHPHRTTYRDRVHAVELDAAHALAGVVGNDLHRLLVALQQGAGGHH